MLAPAASLARDGAAWAFVDSDLPVDPKYVFGTLDNGMRYVVRRNATPQGTALVRMRIGSGSLAETDDERGLAHFVEHMAFNGSNAVPEGEMIRLLEREGLAFGADTNASTGFDETIYRLDLPRGDPALLATALMLMREIASELTIAPGAVERERGVVLSERRDRTNYQLTNARDQFAFATPDARYVDRLPIGALEVLERAGAEELRAFYAREYVPANTVLVVVGDLDPALVERAIIERFGDWAPAPAPVAPAAGPVDIARGGETRIHLDPALSERVTIFAHAPFVDQPDSVANRRQALLRRVGYGIVNRRLARFARREDAPYRSAGFGTGDVFEEARVTRIVIDAADGEWRKGIAAAIPEVTRALDHGFTEEEVAEQLAAIRTAQENAVAGAATRAHATFVGAALRLVADDRVPTTPTSGLERLEAAFPGVTPDAVLQALREDAASLDDPLIRFIGRAAPEGGAEALRAAVTEAASIRHGPPEDRGVQVFAYDEFGPPGAVVADETDPALGIRRIRFANNVRLNLKRTDLAEDRIAFSAEIDGGRLLNTREAPLATAMVSAVGHGGLGAHSADELQTILAGRSVGYGLGAGADMFYMGATTTPRDLALQLQLAAALLTDPGYRPEAETRYARSIAQFFANLDATPARALGTAQGAIVSDGDPRFSLQPQERYDALDFDGLRAAIGDRLARGAIEIGLVGDFDEDRAIALVARTFGALPPREAAFRERPSSRQRGFTPDRTPRQVAHTGEPDQALLRMIWPTADDEDQAQDVALGLLARVVRLELTEELRERLGKAYSPSAASATSSIYEDWGTFSLTASLDVDQVDAARAAMLAVIARLRDAPVDADTLERARRPALEAYDNALKANAGWSRLVDRAQTKPERIARFIGARALIERTTPAAIQTVAGRYLDPGTVLEILVLPEAQHRTEAAKQ